VADAPALALDRVSRRYNGVAAVDRVSLVVASGEFFSLVGPSGSGKTTTLRLIAGFDDPEPDGGTIRMLGQVVNGKRPYQRPIGMVFQSYALFPHLTVAGNIAFGLEERRVPKDEIRRQVERGLELVRLDPDTYFSRRTTELSGGQRQRVALARALVLEPQILLLDEPLAALDPQLRVEMRLELRELNRRLGITFVLVTHDQEEALVMSDRVAVMSAGRIMQIGSPVEIYRHPRTAFVAEFIGEANIYRGRVAAVLDGIATVAQLDGRTWRAPVGSAVAAGDELQVAVRPEWHELVAGDSNGPDTNALPGRIREINFLGETSHAVVALPDGRDVRVALHHSALTAGSRDWRSGDAVTVRWRVEDAQVLER
jgi:ABC-type Fe3+/spermidine/putrescine transport system ATPase subunit